MATFHEFLMARFEAGGFSTEDVLASFLPLARQVIQTHAAGRVAPLDGVNALQVEGVQIWFPESAAKEPTRNSPKLQMLDNPVAGVEDLSEHKRTIDVDDGPEKVANLQIGVRDQEVVRPVYLPGYVCWEQQVGHHDPVSDVFCLGMILASLACSLDFNQPEELGSFVVSRRNLFRLNKALHPVLAKAIVRMTELSRHRRPQDLATLVDNLEHYRDQNIDFAFDLASTEAESSGAAGSRKTVILGKLQERLFELSRRNRLLHFRGTLGAVNLTQASVPLSFDVASIRPEQILTWGGPFAKAVSATEPISLNRYLNFTEQLYLPSVLDRIRSEAIRDAAEFGFEQLRLAICFLRWTNVKADPPEQYDSPLVLLPVRLVKKKGVRDSYWLQPLTDEAEINPIIRHLFKRLYDIDLPAMVDLSETTLDQLYDDLAKRITASEPGISLNKVDRPRIDLIHDLAKRRLDRYRRSARLSGRGIRSFLEIDYSYDPSNFHPLGLALFKAKVRPSPTHLREIVQDKPAPRQFMVTPAENETFTAQKDRQFYAIREEADDNPYSWDFDLCRLTLGNFKYRKMTLVRDYAELLGQPADGMVNPAFDSTFSLVARPVEVELPKAPPLEDRFHVVACDPTQAQAIGLARTGSSYIIQGPPGTGKSQTITNLIADYVMRGKKVLFVCEKRAAIDVVYARLRQQGLHQLCCLIHDSQTDKKEFILDLKATYEGLLAEQQTKPKAWHRRRANLLKTLRDELEPLEQFNQSMLASPACAGVTVRQVLDRAIELTDVLPCLSAAECESLPSYAQWLSNAETIGHLASAIADIQPDGVLARHPLRLLSPKVAGHDRPTQLIDAGLRTAQRLLTELTAALTGSGVPADQWRTFADMTAMLDYAAGVEYLAARKLMGLLDEQSQLAQRFTKASKRYASARATLASAKEGTRHWIEKLPAEDLADAIEQARGVEGRAFAFLRPAWWRLRKVLSARYNFRAHAIKPRWTKILAGLEAEYKASDAVAVAEKGIREEFCLDETVDAVAARVQQAQAGLAQLSETVWSLHRSLLQSDEAGQTVERLVKARQTAQQLGQVCATFMEDFTGRPLEELSKDLGNIERSLGMLSDFLYCLGQLAQLPAEISAAFRSMPLNARQLEATVVNRCVEELFRSDRVLNRFNGAVRDGHVRRLDKLCRKWHEANAAAVLEQSRRDFLEHIRISSLPAAQLTADQKEFKAGYNRGRRELEHEFGKIMRHKSIRDIVAGDASAVVFDIKPVWLMSPLSVSDTLPLRTDAFDVVIFDEASQITLEEAVPSIFRATQAIVVGDEMQLPPTDFFSAKADGEDEDGLRVNENGQLYEYDLSSNSFLNHAAKNLPARMLGWHYRSRSESLISFSNWAFYQGKLLTVPEQQLAASGRGEIVARAATDGAANVARLLDRPMSFHFMQGGVYDNRRNRMEADYIAELVRGMLCGKAAPGCAPHHSIGIVAFSEAQQSEIESALSRLAEGDHQFADRLEEEYEREVDGQYVGLLIKNLENIQGDERDVVILSICYGYASDGKMRMNFGPINQSGGEKRLNVAFSRAKHHMAVVGSIRHADITNDYNDGANCLKSYLHYAEVCSAGDVAGSQRVLRELAVWRDVEAADEVRPSVVVEQIGAALQQRGYAVDLGVGLSHFRCDVAARRHGELSHRLGVLVDTDTHYQQDDLLERELLRPQLLRTFGWRIAHVLCRDWFHDRGAVLDRLVQLIETGSEIKSQPAEPEEEELEDAWAEWDGREEEPEAAPPPAYADSAVPGAGGATSVPTPAASRPAVGIAVGPFKRYFEFVGGTSSKFWELALEGNAVTVRFGRIGTSGQTQRKVFADETSAARAAARLIREKFGKGYGEKTIPAA